MKKTILFGLLFFLLCNFGFFSCQQDLDDVIKQEDTDLITEAKAFFEQEITVKTRSTKELPLGDFAPMWDKAKVSRSQLMEGVDIPIVSTYSYYTIRKEVIGGRNRSYIANVSEKTIVVKSSKHGVMGLYRMLIVPDYMYFQKNKGDLSGKFTNFGNKENFSGIIFYLAVDGKIPLRADTYKDGVKVNEVSLFVNDFETYKRNLIELSKMLPALKIYRQSNLAATRLGWEDPLEDDDFWSGDSGPNGNWSSIGNGFYHDGNGNVGYDYDGDGKPDGIWLPDVDVTPDDNPEPPGFDDDPEPPGLDDDSMPDPTPPTTPGGGGGNLTPVAPKAMKIFRNSGMTEANWKTVERMLEKIMQDCMGEALYNGLSRYLNGKTLVIQFKNGGNGSFGANGISLGMQAESNQLFHEMMHAYRSYKETTSSYNSSTLNGEIEAHYAQYLYVSKLPEYPGSKWEKRNDYDMRYREIQNLERYIDNRGNLLSGISEHELETLILGRTVPGLRAAGYTSNNYNYDNNRPALDNFKNIRDLTQNCK
ncbi:hypothetical protein [Bacteroides sp. 224]|uniref:hypothetical protein n=1 Tax=Bacteroides sp. 224 TaxID=2302936 RepID=UPI0013D64947|nr:hypothetical protein [Bacteroides sp. 224]NDV67028.1 hypothetical protein [Bacteroides sp. 224]